MSQSIFGIDIGSYSIKVCELSRSLRDFELVRYIEQPIIHAERLTHDEAVSATLKALLEKNQINPEVVSVSLPAHHMSCRVIELPFTNIKKIEQTIEFELEGYVPVSLDELLVDYHILSVEEDRSTVLTAYIPRSRFVSYLDILQTAGVDPKYVGVDSIDMSAIALIAMVPQDATYAILDIGHEKTNVCVMQGTKLLYVRSISIGGLNFTKAIQKSFRLNVEKAEALKLDRGRVGLREESLDQIARICQKIAEELIIGIRQTYLGFKQIYPKMEWSSIYLTGGGSRLKGFSELLSQALRINVNVLDSLDFISHPLSQPEVCRDVIAPSLAQTLRVIFSNKAVKINFRRGEFAFKRDIKALGGEIKQVAFWFCLVFLLGLCHFGFRYYTLNSHIEKASKSLVERITKSIPELKTAKKQNAKQLLTQLSTKTGELDAELEAALAGAQSNTPLVLLKEIAQKLPPKSELKLDVDLFDFNGEQVRLEGRTASFDAVDKIKQQLSTSTLFKNVTTQSVTKGIRDEIKFVISMEVNG